MNKILIATPIFNGARTIERLERTIPYDIKWIVYNDGSTDETSDILYELQGCRDIDVYNAESNSGLTYGRNFLSEKFATDERYSEYTHMIFIDVDDYFLPGWVDKVYYWLQKVSSLYPDEKSPYLCFKYWNDRTSTEECQVYTKLNTQFKIHQAVCQYYNGGYDLLHVIPKQYLKEVKEYDGNYYHVIKDEKWTPDTYNFFTYTDYKASFIGDMVAALGKVDENMSSSYYDNIVTKYAKGQIDEIIAFMDIYGSDSKNLNFDWAKVPAFRWRWYLKCLVRMIQNGTLVVSDKKWDNYISPLNESKTNFNTNNG